MLHMLVFIYVGLCSCCIGSSPLPSVWVCVYSWLLQLYVSVAMVTTHPYENVCVCVCVHVLYVRMCSFCSQGLGVGAHQCCYHCYYILTKIYMYVFML